MSKYMHSFNRTKNQFIAQLLEKFFKLSKFLSKQSSSLTESDLFELKIGLRRKTSRRVALRDVDLVPLT
ncbi:hypothetical protein BpHYR1_027011 [Brachionus plicatilis]|uniref:Uncharacterized protein n=1 Tax=Brachionus plicatilis TaxID=10195 RepID=A0A3M7SPX8_BRAPC|nr:hypothetical protein BpHYR1_027011 [Brachionus plicatilis]